MTDSYMYIIVALMPLAALMLTLQVNPYHALVIRGILGAVSALVYAVLGAADVALTEALVGTMLAVTLSAVAIRSSLVMRLGVLQDSVPPVTPEADRDTLTEKSAHHSFAQLIAHVRTIASQHHLRLELVPYPDLQSLNRALMEKEVHATCMGRSPSSQDSGLDGEEPYPYQMVTRVRRLYEILKSELTAPATSLRYMTAPDSGETH